MLQSNCNFLLLLFVAILDGYGYVGPRRFLLCKIPVAAIVIDNMYLTLLASKLQIGCVHQGIEDDSQRFRSHVGS